MGVGGVQRTQDPPYYSLWNEATCADPDGDECGSNYGSALDLVAPAKSVLSTLYNNWNHNPLIPCGDRAPRIFLNQIESIGRGHGRLGP